MERSDGRGDPIFAEWASVVASIMGVKGCRLSIARVMAVVLAICGLPGSGRRSVAATLCDMHCDGEDAFAHLQFERPLEEAASCLLGRGDNEPSRELVRRIGTVVSRGFLAERLCQELADAPPSRRHVISDLRFHRELDTLRLVYGDRLVTVRVTRPPADADDDADDDVMSMAVDIDIDNDGTLEHLQHVVTSALSVGDLFEERPKSFCMQRMQRIQQGMQRVEEGFSSSDEGVSRPLQRVRLLSLRQGRAIYSMEGGCLGAVPNACIGTCDLDVWALSFSLLQTSYSSHN